MLRRSLLAVPLFLLAACIATAPEGIQRQTDQDGVGGDTIDVVTVATGAGGANGGVAPTTDPHATLGAAPSHGPFTGGQHVIITGKGFEPSARVWFGDTEAEGVIAIDPTRVQVSSPPGPAGPVDLATQNGDDASTRRVLVAGYTFDALYAEPSDGPVSGGTVIRIFGEGGGWDDTTTARVDQKPCTALTVASPFELLCTVPQGTPGAKAITVTTGDEVLTALDAYTYQDSEDGFKGGLSGEPLSGTLKVLVYDNFSGLPLAAAHVVAGDDLATGLYAQADGTGVVLFQDPALEGAVTVTVAAKCHSPITFVDVPVDTVTVYLDPVLSPLCIGDGDPPPVGGTPTTGGAITGELVWEGGVEFKKADWTNVPAGKPHEERVAFVFFASRDPERKFNPPSSTFTVYPDSAGDLGYGFQVPATPGNQTLYALAGIRNTVTGSFSAYAMGVVKGVAVAPQAVTGQVYVDMMTPFDQELTLDAASPPTGPTGPDRLFTSVTLEIAHGRYAALPRGQQVPLIPLGGPISYVGLPPLDDHLLGARYVVSARAVTGPGLTAPLSSVGRVATTSTGQPVSINGFVGVPILHAPAPNTAWDATTLGATFAAGGLPTDLTVFEVTSGGGLWRWVVAAPTASAAEVRLPDLSGFDMAHLPPGPLVIGVYGARIDDFDYGQLAYASLRPGGMQAYSLDVFNAHL